MVEGEEGSGGWMRKWESERASERNKEMEGEMRVEGD